MNYLHYRPWGKIDPVIISFHEVIQTTWCEEPKILSGDIEVSGLKFHRRFKEGQLRVSVQNTSIDQDWIELTI